MKTLMASGRISPKGERPRRADSIVVIVKLEGEDARRFEAYRGDKCPRAAVRGLMLAGMGQVEQMYREIEEEYLAHQS